MAKIVLGLVTVLALTQAVFGQQICEQFGSTVSGNYIVMNNRWGTSEQHCIDVQGNGFRITTQNCNLQGGAPCSYPAIYYGCHYTNCSPGTKLPKQLRSINSAMTAITYTYVDSVYDASYDIWLDPQPKTDGVNQQEIMIWLDRTGGVQPVGSPVGNIDLEGENWQVWQGSNGSNNVVSYVAPGRIPAKTFNLLPFLQDVRNRGFITDDWYLTSIQAGFEPWKGGVGLAVSGFSADVN